MPGQYAGSIIFYISLENRAVSPSDIRKQANRKRDVPDGSYA